MEISVTKYQEDTIFMIHKKVRELGIIKQFNKQLNKMKSQDKYKYIDMADRWEYAYNKIK
jgi:hypothetical protein